MKATGARMAVKALEDGGVRFAFGIPGTHNLELYDALEASSLVEPVLVTDEQSASFMADAVSRTTDTIGAVNLVPGAGVTHALSGIAEAFMDNIPLLVLTCGVRKDTGKAYQLHDIDQIALLKPVTKEAFRCETVAQVYGRLRGAIELARTGTPGPVAVEIPVNVHLFADTLEPGWDGPAAVTGRPPTEIELEQIARKLTKASHPALYFGNGARGAGRDLVELAERLGAPVTTSIQGKGAFPESHPLFLWNGFGPSTPRFVRRIMDRCDCLLAVGCRFGEVATASYGLNVPKNLVHVDINPSVFNRNYPAELAIEADAAELVSKLLAILPPGKGFGQVAEGIARGNLGVFVRWNEKRSKTRVTPSVFFGSLQQAMRDDAVIATDSGNGTFLAMEHLRLGTKARFIAPIDYSCMGYAVPAAIGAKLANPGRDVIALAGDGALLMTGLELLTAAHHRLAPVVFVLRDGALAQIAHFQRMSVGRQTCTWLPDYSVEAIAAATCCRYLSLAKDEDVPRVVPEAVAAGRNGTPVMIEVAIDYDCTTYFTKGVIATNFWRLPWSERVKKAARLVSRKLEK